MRISEKCLNNNKHNNSNNPLTSRRTDGGKNIFFVGNLKSLSISTVSLKGFFFCPKRSLVFGLFKKGTIVFVYQCQFVVWAALTFSGRFLVIDIWIFRNI